MKISPNILSLLKLLKKTYPNAHCELGYVTPLQLLVATILSAQCTDKRVNQVAPLLFARYNTAKDLASAKLPELENIIRSTGFFRNKAQNIKGACQVIIEKFNGQVPDTMDNLLALPGVARKTANVVLGTAFGKADGIVVDTHVSRVTQRLGLTSNKNPEKIEKDLMLIIPQKDWILFSHQIIRHGRAVCKARSPLCAQCPLHNICPWVHNL